MNNPLIKAVFSVTLYFLLLFLGGRAMYTAVFHVLDGSGTDKTVLSAIYLVLMLLVTGYSLVGYKLAIWVTSIVFADKQVSEPDKSERES